MVAFLIFLITNMKVELPKEDLLYRESLEKPKLMRITF
jgi:hypothetical protein